MAVILNKLTDRKLRSNMSSGHHADGGGLYIRVKKSGAKSWAFRWKRNGRVREIGLGGYPTVSLDTARSIAKQHRDTLANGEVPKPFGKVESIPSFSEVVNEFLADKESQWSSPKHRQQWRNTLEQYCHKIASKLVSEIDLTDVMIILKPIWKEKPETASRLRGRIEKVLAYATIKKYRTGVNPAVWKGNLEHILPKPEKLSRGHHKAMPYDKLPEFLDRLILLKARQPKLSSF